jgi:hypothetical protein
LVVQRRRRRAAYPQAVAGRATAPA